MRHPSQTAFLMLTLIMMMKMKMNYNLSLSYFPQLSVSWHRLHSCPTLSKESANTTSSSSFLGGIQNKGQAEWLLLGNANHKRQSCIKRHFSLQCLFSIFSIKLNFCLKQDCFFHNHYDHNFHNHHHDDHTFFSGPDERAAVPVMDPAKPSQDFSPPASPT